ncbi:unnamed protein product [Symbiodinium sp. CCMP2456]|nr:unnamed protein product [Symbiodinium sp. CCMP2456]
MMYVDILFLSPAQVLRYTGGTPQSLGLPIIQRTAEDGQTLLHGCYLSASDPPEDISVMQWLSFRRVRLFCETSTLHAKKALQGHNQIQAEQGSALLTLLEKRRVAQDEGLPAVGKLSDIKTLTELRDRVSKRDEQKRAQEEKISEALALAGLDAPPEPPVEIVDEEKKTRLQAFAVDTAEAGPAARAAAPAPKRRRKTPASAAGVSEFSQQESNPPRSRASKVSKADEESGVGGSKQDDEFIRQALAHDLPMMKVALYLQTVPDCLKCLNPTQAMLGIKLGNQTFAAKRLLPSIQDEGLAKLLTRRCALMEAIKDLVQTKDLRTLNPEELKKRYQLLKSDPEGSLVVPTDSLKLKVLTAAVSAQSKHMVETMSDGAILDFLNMVTPFATHCAGFDYFAPTMKDTILEAIARVDPGVGSWDMMAKEELQDLPEPMPVSWEAVNAVNNGHFGV